MKTLREEMLKKEYVLEKDTLIICYISKSIFNGKLYRRIFPVRMKDDIGNGCGMALDLKDDRTILDERFIPYQVPEMYVEKQN